MARQKLTDEERKRKKSEQNKLYYEANAAKLGDERRVRYLADREQRLMQMKRYYEMNREKMLVQARLRHQRSKELHLSSE